MLRKRSWSTLEYLNAEARYLADRPMIPPGCLSEVRLQDLSADPIGELKRIYRELGLPWSAVYERSLPNLLAALNERQPNQHPELTEAQQARVARLAHLKTTFGHDRPPIAKAGPAAAGLCDSAAAMPWPHPGDLGAAAWWPLRPVCSPGTGSSRNSGYFWRSSTGRSASRWDTPCSAVTRRGPMPWGPSRQG